MTTTLMTPETLLAELRRAAPRDDLDRQILRLQQTIDLLAEATSRLTTWTAVRDRLLAAKATIEQQRAAAVDYRTIANARARDREWARQEALAASLRALRVGVEHANGQPCLPAPLRALLTETCPHCSDTKLHWAGSLVAAEEKVAEAERQIAEQQAALARLTTAAEALVAEPVKA